MFCKHCGAEIEPERKECSACGAPVEESKPIVLSRGMKMAISIVLCVALVLGLAYIVFLGAGGTWEDITQFVTGLFTPKENNIFYKDSYTADESKLDKTANQVIATVGDMTLTNAQLQVFYYEGYYSIIRQVGDNAWYYGLDYSKPLDQQVYDSKTGKTWQQMLLEEALNAWTKYALIAQDAQKNGYQLAEEDQKKLDNFEADMAEAAKEYKYADVTEMVLKEYGAGVTLADYKNYFKLNLISNRYLVHQVETTELTLEQIDAWYTERAADFEASGLTKDCGNMTDVRHLLIAIEEIAGETKTEYTPQEWEICRQKAQQLWDQWQEGEKTEESFAALVKEHSDDAYTVPDGGLIPYVYKNGQYVEEFEAWCIDTTRVKGDSGLVKTSYGYHVMYCVETDTAWIRSSRETMLYEKEEELWDSYNTPADVQYKLIAIANVTFGE